MKLGISPNIKLYWLFSKKRLFSCPRKYYYEELMNKYKDASSYENLKNIVSRRQTVYSEKNISEKILGSLGFNKSDARKHYGRALYSFTVDKYLGIELLFFRVILGRHKAKLEMHFKEDKLFHYSYRFCYLKEKDKREIIQIFEHKYLNGNQFDYQNFNLSDSNKTVINIDDSVDFTINYLFHNNTNLFTIVEQFNANKLQLIEKRRKSRTKELFNKL